MRWNPSGDGGWLASLRSAAPWMRHARGVARGHARRQPAQWTHTQPRRPIPVRAWDRRRRRARGSRGRASEAEGHAQHPSGHTPYTGPAATARDLARTRSRTDPRPSSTPPHRRSTLRCCKGTCPRSQGRSRAGARGGGRRGSRVPSYHGPILFDSPVMRIQGLRPPRARASSAFGRRGARTDRRRTIPTRADCPVGRGRAPACGVSQAGLSGPP